MKTVADYSMDIITELNNEIVRLKQEIIEHRHREQEAWHKFNRLNMATSIAPALIYVLRDSSFLYVNSTFAKVTGYTQEECLNTCAWDFIHPDYREMTKRKNLDRQRGEYIPPYETRILTRNGNIYWGLLSSEMIDFYGQTAAMGIIQDISESKKAEQALLVSEANFAKVFQATPNIMAITTIDGVYKDVNEKFITTAGYSKHEVIGQTARELKIWVNPDERDAMIEEVLKHGSVRNLEVKIHVKDGSERIGLVSAEALELNGEQCIISIMNDITEHKLMSNQITRLDQLNLVGEIAASIGHEMRNPMTSVRGFLQMFMADKLLVPYHEYFSLMIEELDRANHIISEFLSLAKNKTIMVEPSNLKQIVMALSPLITADAIKQDKYLALHLKDVPDLLLDKKEIRQLILNLVRNGLESMADGNIITIMTYETDNDIILEVKDQGTGIESDILDKIDAPFFTTKDQGTGLGLPVCFSIAARHNAAIEVKTSRKGTSFIVRFKKPNMD